jgi:hypothetical protein
VAEETEGRSRPVEGGSRTVHLVTPVTFHTEHADEERIAQAFDKLIKDGAARGDLADCGVTLVGFSVIQPAGSDLPLGIE